VPVQGRSDRSEIRDLGDPPAQFLIIGRVGHRKQGHHHAHRAGNFHPPLHESHIGIEVSPAHGYGVVPHHGESHIGILDGPAGTRSEATVLEYPVVGDNAVRTTRDLILDPGGQSRVQGLIGRHHSRLVEPFCAQPLGHATPQLVVSERPDAIGEPGPGQDPDPTAGSMRATNSGEEIGFDVPSVIGGTPDARGVR